MTTPEAPEEDRPLRDLGSGSERPARELTAQQQAAMDAVWANNPPQQETPRGPWRWTKVVPDGEDREYGEALVDDEGTWIIWADSGSLEVHPAVKDLLAKAHVVGLLRELFELWDLYCDTEGPVQQASVLIEFSNWVHALRWSYEQEPEVDGE